MNVYPHFEPCPVPRAYYPDVPPYEYADYYEYPADFPPPVDDGWTYAPLPPIHRPPAHIPPPYPVMLEPVPPAHQDFAPPRSHTSLDRLERRPSLGCSYAAPKGSRLERTPCPPTTANTKPRPISQASTTARAHPYTRSTTSPLANGSPAAPTRIGGMVSYATRPQVAAAAQPQQPTPTARTVTRQHSNPSSHTVGHHYKRKFESIRSSMESEAEVAQPMHEVASQMLYRDEAEVIVTNEKGVKCSPRYRQKISIDKAALKRGLLAARSSRGAQLALYLYSLEEQMLVSADDMFCQMRICVGDIRLVPASGNGGVHLNIMPALEADTVNGPGSLEITLDMQEESLIQGFAMICLRRLASEPQDSSSYSVLPSIRRMSNPVTSPGLQPEPRAQKRPPPAPARSTRPSVSSTATATNVEDDEEIEIVDQIVTLTCPLSLTRIRIPAKGMRCKHVQCFDAETFLQIYMSSPIWKCGVCNNVIQKTDLTISEPFVRYLASYPDADRCVIRGDGSHMPYVSPPNPTGQQQESDIVDLDDDDHGHHSDENNSNHTGRDRAGTVEPPDVTMMDSEPVQQQEQPQEDGGDRFGRRNMSDVPAGGLCAASGGDVHMVE
ncbi:hypothetical protein HK097_002075 [Rhizophlyctis rosea]|uniref:SP-RING-type domain-containing protein n=1 Tax=Rhizophlyctis rosea TaxID=64517 RepID=A0AAD5S3S5_9FUNG|nr:hypothetical protein HK097_002075 [Rhizophlyctis rosea]